MVMCQSPSNDTVAGLYAVFGDGPLGRALIGCECCSDPKRLHRLAETPVRHLPADDLQDYLYSAMSTVGDEEDFKHFLPRLFELAIQEPDSIEPELLGIKLSAARWKDWPDRHQSAVSAALETLWQDLFVKEYDEFAVDSIFCGLALARMDVVSRLQAWASTSSSLAKVNFDRFKEHNRASLKKKRRLANAFWDESPAQEVLVADWLRAAMGV